MIAAVDVASDGVRAPISHNRVREIVQATLRTARVKNAMISVAFVSRRRIAALNRQHLGHEGPTDVISFGFAGAQKGGPLVADIYISPEVARDSAREHGDSVRREVARLVIHGTLHALGHDHPDGTGRTQSRMWRMQERLVARLTRSKT